MSLRQTGIPVGGARCDDPPDGRDSCRMARWAHRRGNCRPDWSRSLRDVVSAPPVTSRAVTTQVAVSTRGLMSRNVVLTSASCALLVLGQACWVSYLVIYLLEDGGYPSLLDRRC